MAAIALRPATTTSAGGGGTGSDPQSLNSYSYSNGNPITKSDPNGTFAAAALAPVVLGGGLALYPATLGMSALIAGGVVAAGAVGYYGIQYLLENMHGAPVSRYTKDGWTYGIGNPSPVPQPPPDPGIPKGFWPSVLVASGLLAGVADQQHDTYQPTGIFGNTLYGSAPSPTYLTPNSYTSTVTSGARMELARPTLNFGPASYVNQAVAGANALNSALNKGGLSVGQQQSAQSTLNALVNAINPNKNYYESLKGK